MKQAREVNEGSLVHYVLNGSPNAGEHRPAIVVKVWRHRDDETGELVAGIHGTCQLQVFTDSDWPVEPFGKTYNDYRLPVMWKSSVMHDGEAKAPGTWHWPEEVKL